MNERIQELAEQALISSMTHDGVYRPEGYANSVSKAFADKFANLIIQECITNVKLWETDSRNHISYMLEQHFGVTK